MSIILLILSFAYLSISLDISGFFKAAATYVVGLARGNGHRLLIYVYLLCSCLTYFTSNDIVILSMTPLLMHVGDCSSIRDAVPLLVTQYIAANTASMGLLVGSPSNIILGEGVGLGELDAHMVVCDPTSYRSIISTKPGCTHMVVRDPTSYRSIISNQTKQATPSS